MATLKMGSTTVLTDTTLANGVQDNITRLGTVTAGTLDGARLTDLKSTDGGESAITSDASGYVKFPQLPSFWVQKSGGELSDPGGIMPFNSVKFQNGISFSTSTYKATIPTAGLYYFRAFSIHKDATQHFLGLHTSAGQFAATHSYDAGTWGRIGIDGIIELSASETVWAQLDLGGSAEWHGNNYSGFYGFLVG